MKNRMKKLTAAILALCCVPVAGLTASAEGLPHYWGETTWDALEGMEQINTYGLMGGLEAYVSEEDHSLFTVYPVQQIMLFVLNDTIEMEEGGRQIAEILDPYFPGMAEHYGSALSSYASDPVKGYCIASIRRSGTNDRAFELQVEALPENADELESSILLALARKHLISGFYGWGETACYSRAFWEGTGDPMKRISNYYHQYGTTDSAADQEYVDWDAVQAFLDAQYPGLTVDPYDVVYDFYQITGADGLSYREKIELRFELAAKFGCELVLISYAEENYTKGHNGLLKPGDVTLDTDITIVDVIALNRNIMTGDPLCDTAKQNADLNGSGAPDEADSLDLLKYIVGINDSLL
ncbi:MAG: dockerin type I repeat-containing protein [Oscillospiraceae bacterium]|nr:dockerin type I repeat-containing protein [Oscillospiraceae bacterium]